MLSEGEKCIFLSFRCRVSKFHLPRTIRLNQNSMRSTFTVFLCSASSEGRPRRNRRWSLRFLAGRLQCNQPRQQRASAWKRRPMGRNQCKASVLLEHNPAGFPAAKAVSSLPSSASKKLNRGKIYHSLSEYFVNGFHSYRGRVA